MSDHVFRREHNIIMITANDISRRVLELYLFLTLSGVAPSAVSKGWDGADWAPPQVSKGVGVVLVPNFSCNLRSDHD